MTAHLKCALLLAQNVLQRLALLVFVLAACGMAAASLAAALGVMPWLEISAGFGGEPQEHAGRIAQLGLTVLALLLCFFLPTNARILALETSHRRFATGMQDDLRAVLPELGLEETMRRDGTVIGLAPKAAE